MKKNLKSPHWITYQRKRLSRADFEEWRVKPNIARALIEEAKKIGKGWQKLVPKELAAFDADYKQNQDRVWLECLKRADKELLDLEEELQCEIEDRTSSLTFMAEALCMEELTQPPHWNACIKCDYCGPVFAATLDDSCRWCEILSLQNALIEEKTKAWDTHMEQVFETLARFEKEWDLKNPQSGSNKWLEEALDKSLEEWL